MYLATVKTLLLTLLLLQSLCFLCFTKLHLCRLHHSLALLLHLDLLLGDEPLQVIHRTRTYTLLTGVMQIPQLEGGKNAYRMPCNMVVIRWRFALCLRVLFGRSHPLCNLSLAKPAMKLGGVVDLARREGEGTARV